MKKKILVLFAFILLFTITGCNSGKEVNMDNFDKDLKVGIEKLSKKEKKAMDLNKLDEDVKELKANATIKNAEYDSKSDTYKGKGYYIKVMQGGEIVSYVFYSSVSDKEFYIYDIIYPMTSIDE